MKDDIEEPTCECCDFPTELNTYKTGYPPRDFQLCDICASTFLAKAVTYPQQVSDPDLYKALGFIGNLILSKLPK
jgi:hypothetical protein